MSRRLAPVLLSIVFSFSCASFPDLPVAPIVNFDSFPIVGAARINYEAVDPEEQEILQPAAVSISARGESVGGISIRLALRPGEAEVIRLKPGFYEYEISGARKAPQKGSFEIRPPDKMLFELTLSLNLPVRQAYLWHSVGQKHNTTLHHPTVPITILSDSPQKLRFFARAAQGYRYRAPKPLSRCPEEPEEPEEQTIKNQAETLLGNLVGNLAGKNDDVGTIGSIEANCYWPGVSPDWHQWMDQLSIQDVRDGFVPDERIEVTKDFEFVLDVPANVTLPAGAWLITNGEKEAVLEIEEWTRIVVVDWDKSPPDIHALPERK
jgi:hypothetical protein